MNWENPYCLGIGGVIQAYHQSLAAVQLFGPTNVAPIINHVARFAGQAAANEQPGTTATQVTPHTVHAYNTEEINLIHV